MHSFKTGLTPALLLAGGALAAPTASNLVSLPLYSLLGYQSVSLCSLVEQARP